MEERKRAEIEFYNAMWTDMATDPEHEKYYSNVKFYSVIRRTSNFAQEWLLGRCRDKRVLVYGCGNGAQSFYLAKAGAQVVGIDISDVSIQQARERAIAEGVQDRATFLVMDCEALTFDDDSFDVIVACSVLSHLYLPQAYQEMARVLKPEGEIICIEPLRHNPIIQLYRRLTPHLRTAWEVDHILGVNDLKLAKKYFGKVDARFFHLFTIAAVPFRKTRIFEGLLGVLEAIDSVVLRVPFVRRQAWQMVFNLSQPNKAALR